LGEWDIEGFGENIYHLAPQRHLNQPTLPKSGQKGHFGHVQGSKYPRNIHCPNFPQRLLGYLGLYLH
jgi:hypothetical protein